MPKLTPEQRAELEAQLAADDADDDDFEFDYSEGDRGIRLPWSKRHELEGFGFKGAPKRPEAKKDGDDDKTKAPPRNVSVFGPRRTGTGK